MGYFAPTDEPLAKNTLVYILAYPSREAVKKSREGETRHQGGVGFRRTNRLLTPNCRRQADRPVTRLTGPYLPNLSYHLRAHNKLIAPATA